MRSLVFFFVWVYISIFASSQFIKVITNNLLGVTTMSSWYRWFLKHSFQIFTGFSSFFLRNILLRVHRVVGCFFGCFFLDGSHEAYAKNYSIVYPHDEPLAGRDLLHSALHPQLLAAGCVFQAIRV